MIEFANGVIRVDVAKRLRIEPSLVQAGLREGRITSLCELGLDKREQRRFVTFSASSGRFRLLFDNEANVLQRKALDFGNRSRPLSTRNLGA